MKQLFLNNDFESFKVKMQKMQEERQAEQKKFQDSVTREVTNIDNGIVMTMTSSNPEIVAKLQAPREERGPKHDDVQNVTENIENGVRITITSTDADTVTRLQTKKEGKGFGMHGRGQIGGGHRGGMMDNNDNE